MLESPKLPIFFFCLSLCLLLVACDKTATPTYQPTFSKAPPITETVYLFGVHPLHNPQRLYEVFGPLMDYLSEQTPGVRFKLVASRNYAAYDENYTQANFTSAYPTHIRL